MWCSRWCACADDAAQAPIRCESIAERYVRLVLAVGQHDADYVDAYYGPPEWRKEAEASKAAAARSIDAQAAALEAELAEGAGVASPARTMRSCGRCAGSISRGSCRRCAPGAMLQGKTLTFDEESRALYDAVAPTHTEAEFQAVLEQLEARLPGEGSLIERYDRYKQDVRHPARRSIACSRRPFAPAASGR